MRWRPSSNNNIEDRRGGGGFGGLGGGLGGLGGGGAGIPIPMGGGLTGIIVFVVFLLLTGGLGGGGLLGGGGGNGAGDPNATLDPADQQAQFINAVTEDIQDFWSHRLPEQANGTTYPITKIVLFTDQTQSGCGVASSATGPFYCPADQKVYLDTGFFDELAGRKFNAPGDFAQAYVIAHEFGHHVQDTLGTMDKVAAKQQQDPSSANALSVRLELQADCYAGIWANSVWSHPDESNVESITDADIKEALDAAAAVGDDRLQRQSTGRVDRETWTHGSSDQRVKWFTRGFQQGTLSACDTFSVAAP